jgi:hypothetical protein
MLPIFVFLIFIFFLLDLTHAGRAKLEAEHVAPVELCRRSHHALNAFRLSFRHGKWELEVLFTILRLSPLQWACHPPSFANDTREFWRDWYRVYHTLLRYTSKKEKMVSVWFKGPSQRSRHLVQRVRQSQRTTACHSEHIRSAFVPVVSS